MIAARIRTTFVISISWVFGKSNKCTYRVAFLYRWIQPWWLRGRASASHSVESRSLIPWWIKSRLSQKYYHENNSCTAISFRVISPGSVKVLCSEFFEACIFLGVMFWTRLGTLSEAWGTSLSESKKLNLFSDSKWLFCFGFCLCLFGL